ncbi:MAG TPA: hypothetical protein VH394_13610 [Thermoanaerobaculia bacterium]|jgi:hypothetical protein|nr:hypothetical protein [Thermoanaerobaculia bacterium]
MSARKVLLTDPKPGKTIVVRSEAVDTPEVETALRAIREKVDSIGSHLDRSVAVLARLEAKLGEVA